PAAARDPGRERRDHRTVRPVRTRAPRPRAGRSAPGALEHARAGARPAPRLHTAARHAGGVVRRGGGAQRGPGGPRAGAAAARRPGRRRLPALPVRSEPPLHRRPDPAARADGRAGAAPAGRVRATAQRTVVAGHPVLLLPDRAPVAFALPRRHGGIVISRGLLDSLSPRELSAVLAHEQAHLSQHHHSVLAVLDAIAGPLRMIPLFDAVVTAVPHLLEIAADDVSRHRSGTPALASALLRLAEAGAAAPSASPSTAPGALLHATGPVGSGPDRIGHLVSPAAARSALVPTTALAALLAPLVGSAITLVAPYATLLLNGCAVPL